MKTGHQELAAIFENTPLIGANLALADVMLDVSEFLAGLPEYSNECGTPSEAALLLSKVDDALKKAALAG